jgi:hypothetical protein
MSAPSSELARVREILRARGYLAPPGSSGTRGFWPRLAGWSLLLAATCTLAAVSAGGGAAASLPLFTLAAWPTVAVLVFVATRLGNAAAARLLAWGARPEQVALAMGALAAVGVALAVAGCTGGGDPRPPGWLGLGAGLLLALHAFRASRRELLTTFHLEEGSRTPGPWGAAAVVVAGALALAWPSSGKPQLPWAPLSGLVPKTRVAVLAVDGLSREELRRPAGAGGAGVTGGFLPPVPARGGQSPAGGSPDRLRASPAAGEPPGPGGSAAAAGAAGKPGLRAVAVLGLLPGRLVWGCGC